MRTFVGQTIPEDPKHLPRVLRDIQNDIKRAAQEPGQTLSYLSIAPTRPVDGLYLSAAGILGASRGLYRYDSSLGTYTFIA